MTGVVFQTGAAALWELRAAWATRREVVLVLSERADLPRVRGTVEHVAPTGTVVHVLDEGEEDPIVVPAYLIRAVRRPHFHEDGVEARPAPAPRDLRALNRAAEGQRRIGEERAPEMTSRLGRRSMERAVDLMLGEDLLKTLAAVDAAAGGRARFAETGRIAAALERSPAWTLRRLRELAVMQLVLRRREGRGYVWSVSGS
jgi:hypothetical protein